MNDQLKPSRESLAERQKRIPEDFKKETHALFQGINAGLKVGDERWYEETDSWHRLEVAIGVSAADKLRVQWARKVQMPGYYKAHPYEARDLLCTLKLLPVFLLEQHNGPSVYPGKPVDDVHVPIVWADGKTEKVYVHPDQKLPVSDSPEKKNDKGPVIAKEIAVLLDFYNRPLEEILRDIAQKIDQKLGDRSLTPKNRSDLIRQRSRVIAARMFLAAPQSFLKFRLVGLEHATGSADPEIKMKQNNAIQGNTPRPLDDFFFERAYDALEDCAFFKTRPDRFIVLDAAVEGDLRSLENELKACTDRLFILVRRAEQMGARMLSLQGESMKQMKTLQKEQPLFLTGVFSNVLKKFQQKTDQRTEEAWRTYYDVVKFHHEMMQLRQQIHTLNVRKVHLEVRRLLFLREEALKPASLKAHSSPKAKEALTELYRTKLIESLRKIYVGTGHHLFTQDLALRSDLENALNLVGNDHGVLAIDALRSLVMKTQEAPTPRMILDQAATKFQNVAPFMHVLDDPFIADADVNEVINLPFETDTDLAKAVQDQIGKIPLKDMPIDSSQEIHFQKPTDGVPVWQEWKGTFGALLDLIRCGDTFFGCRVTRTQARVYLASLLKGVPKEEAIDRAFTTNVTREEYPCADEDHRGYTIVASFVDGKYSWSVRSPQGAEMPLTDTVQDAFVDLLGAFSRIPIVERFNTFFSDLYKELEILGVAVKSAGASGTKTVKLCEHLQVHALLLRGMFERSGLGTSNSIQELKDMVEWIKSGPLSQKSLPKAITDFAESAKAFLTDVLRVGTRKPNAFDHLVEAAQAFTEDTSGKKFEEGLLPFILVIVGGVGGAALAREHAKRWVRHSLRRGLLGRNAAHFASTRFGTRVIMDTASNLGLGAGGYVMAELNKIVFSQVLGRRGMQSELEQVIKGNLTVWEYATGVTMAIGKSALMSWLMGWLGQRSGDYLRASIAKSPPGGELLTYIRCRNFAYHTILLVSRKMQALEERMTGMLPGARKKMHGALQKELSEEGGQEAAGQAGADAVAAFANSLGKDAGWAGDVIGYGIQLVWAMGKKGQKNHAGVSLSKLPKFDSSNQEQQYFSTYSCSVAALDVELNKRFFEAGIPHHKRTVEESKDKGTFIMKYERKKGGKTIIYTHEFRPSKAPLFLRELEHASLYEDKKSGRVYNGLVEAFGFKTGLGPNKDECSIDGQKLDAQFWCSVSEKKLQGIQNFFQSQEITAVPVLNSTKTRIAAFRLIHDPSGEKADLKVDPPMLLRGSYWDFP